MIESKLKAKIATVDSCFDIVGCRQYRVYSNDVLGWSTDHPLNAVGNNFRWNSNPIFVQIVTCKTCKDYVQTKTVPQKNHGQAMLKVSSISRRI